MGAWSEWLRAISERSPERARWLVRVFRNENDPKAVGAGVLVDEYHVLTCAHVAAQGPAPERVWVDLPFVAPGERKEAVLNPDGWHPRTRDGRGDLALFHLDAPPEGAVPAILRRPGRVNGHAFRVYGFPPGHPDGDWAAGTILGDAGPGHVQLEVEAGHVIEGGFSGAPVWDHNLSAVIGLVATAEPGARRSFLIPLAEASRRWLGVLEGWIGWRASQDEAFLGHWLDRALGSAAAGERDGYPVSLFCGRDEAKREINRWLEAPPDGRVKLVTGVPGSGKSALLAHLIVLADPAVRRRLAPTPAKSTSPRPFMFDVAVHARQRTLGRIASAIADATGALLDVSPEEWARPEEAAARAVVAIAGAPRRTAGGLTIAVDALDEADRPQQVARLLLEPLARQEGLRVIVASRPGDGDSLLRALGGDPSRAMVLQDPPWFSLEHLARYVRGTLVSLPASPYAAQSEAHVAEIGAAVAAQAAPSYLVAGLTARTLAGRESIIDWGPGWEKDFPVDVDTAMAAYLDSLADPRQARELLLPLAYARGVGLPADGRVWARLAAALTGRPYVLGDVADVRRSAADYLMEEVGGDRRSIRLFHQALAEALRRERPDQRADEADIACALWEPRPEDPRLLPDDGYTRPHLAHHAAAGGVLEGCLVDPGFLASAEPPRLLAALTAVPPRGRLAKRWADIYEYAAPRLSGDPAANVFYLEQAAIHMAPELASSVGQLVVERAFRTLWASPRALTPHRILSGHEGPVYAVAVGSLGDRILIVSASSDRTVRLWDPEHPEAEPAVLRGHEGRVYAVAVGSLGDRTFVVSGGEDGTVRLWDPEQPDAEPAVVRGHASAVMAVAVSSLGDRTFVVSGGEDGTVRLWDPEHPDAAPPVLRGHEGRVYAVAVSSLGGRTLVVSGGEDGTVSLWDPEHPDAERAVLRGHQDWVLAVAVDSARSLIVSGGDDGTVRLWDSEHPDAAPAVLRGHEGDVDAVAVSSAAGRTLVVSGGEDGTVCLWDPERSAEPAVLHGHEDWVRAVAVGSFGDRSLLVSGGDDSTVRLWDPERPDTEPAVLRGHEGRVRAVAVGSFGGRSLVVSAGDDSTVRLWDPERPDTEPAVLHGHEDWVRAVAVGSFGGRSLVVSAGDDSTVRLWDPERPDTEPVALRGHQGRVYAVAVGSFGGRSLVVSGGGDQIVRLWDPERAHAELAVLRGHESTVFAVAVGAVAGRTLVVSGGEDRTVRLWDPERLDAELAVLRGHEGTVNAVAVGPVAGRTMVVSGGDDGTVRLWETNGSSAGLIGMPARPTGLALGGTGSFVLATTSGLDLIQFQG